MTVPGYQCQSCWATFGEDYSCEPHREEQTRCPTCHSTEVKKVDLPDTWAERGRGGFRFG